MEAAIVESDVRIVSFMGDQRGLCEDLYRCKNNGTALIRQECDETHVRWLTASKWSGGYEADCHLQPGLKLQVVDKKGNVLFEELTIQEEGVSGTWAEKVGPFSWEPPQDLAKEYEQRLGLRPYEEWKVWLMGEAEASGFTGYADNWLFAMAERKAPEKIDKIDYLGLTACVTVQEELHKVCGKRWYSYEVMTEDLSTCLAICGYKFEEGGVPYGEKLETR